jgi:ABC-type uncharacterized transport system permease subunit
MQRRAGVPSSIAFILQSLIVLFVLAAELLRRYRFVGFAVLGRGAERQAAAKGPHHE